MANVLTTEEKKRLDRRMVARFVNILALVLIGGACMAMLAILPAFIAVSSARSALSNAGAELLTQEERSAADRASDLVEALSPLVSASSPSMLLAEMLALQPDDVSITAITFNALEEKIMLSGQASREAANEFRTAVQASALFETVEVPVAALVGAQEGRFTMTLTGFK